MTQSTPLHLDWLPGSEREGDSGLRARLEASRGLAVGDRLRALVFEKRLELPELGEGASAQRLRTLAEIAASDLSLARLAEGHSDAVSILREAGEAPAPGIYGVWVAGEPPRATERGAGQR